MIQGDHVVTEILVNKRFGNNSIYSDRFVPEKYNGRAGFVPLRYLQLPEKQSKKKD
jgi:hypothetical protein